MDCALQIYVLFTGGQIHSRPMLARSFASSGGWKPSAAQDNSRSLRRDRGTACFCSTLDVPKTRRRREPDTDTESVLTVLE
jgi:hypothetical protein